MVQEIGALLLFVILKANVLLSFDEQEEKATLVGYTDSADVFDGEVGVDVTLLLGIGVGVTLLLSIGVDGACVVAKAGADVLCGWGVMKIGADCEWDVAKVEYSTNTPPIRAATILAIALMSATCIPSLKRLDFSGLASLFIRLDSPYN